MCRKIVFVVVERRSPVRFVGPLAMSMTTMVMWLIFAREEVGLIHDFLHLSPRIFLCDRSTTEHTHN